MRRNIVLLIISSFLGVIILEFGLRWFTIFPVISWINSQNLNRDELFSFTMAYNRNYGIDSNGFRNPQALKNADIVTIGDSHTFGYNVTTEYSWPYQLSRMTNKSVYNLGVGNYGLVQYYYLMDQAIKLKPMNIIVGFNLATDLNKQTMCLLFNNKELNYRRKWAIENNFNIENCKNTCDEDNPGVSVVKKTYSVFSLNYLKSRIKETAIFTLVEFMIWTPLQAKLFYFNKEIGKTENNNLIIINDGKQNTLFSYTRLKGINNNMDLKKQDIGTAFKIAKKLFTEMKDKADKNETVFTVLFIPSKENVYYEYLLNSKYTLPDEFHQVVQNERNLLKEFSIFFNEAGIKWIDARPYVVNVLYGQDKVYKITLDDHPLESGYQAYAKAVYEHILQ